MAAGATAGVVVGILAFIIILLVLLALLYVRHRRKHPPANEPTVSYSSNEGRWKF